MPVIALIEVGIRRGRCGPPCKTATDTGSLSYPSTGTRCYHLA